MFAHYFILVEGANQPFDSTITRRSAQIFDMKAANTFPGAHMAVSSMELKEVSRFIIKPSLAFGEAGCPPRVPPGNIIASMQTALLQLITLFVTWRE